VAAGNRYRLLFSQQDYVRGVLGTRDGEGFSIRRPLKFGDVFRSEVGDLVSERAVERLHKNVIHALIANDVGHGFPRPSAMRGRNIQYFRRIAPVDKGRSSAVMNVTQTEDGTLDCLK